MVKVSHLGRNYPLRNISGTETPATRRSFGLVPTHQTAGGGGERGVHTAIAMPHYRTVGRRQTRPAAEPSQQAAIMSRAMLLGPILQIAQMHNLREPAESYLRA